MPGGSSTTTYSRSWHLVLPPRNTLGLLGGDGYRAFAPDWPGHGDSDKPAPGAFSYSEEAYLGALRAFVDAVGINKPFALVVQVRQCGLGLG